MKNTRKSWKMGGGVALLCAILLVAAALAFVACGDEKGGGFVFDPYDYSWDFDTFYISFDTDGGIPLERIAVTVMAGTGGKQIKLSQLPTPRKMYDQPGIYRGDFPEAVFVEWVNEEGVPWNFARDRVTQNITLKATWSVPETALTVPSGITGANAIDRAMNYIKSQQALYGPDLAYFDADKSAYDFEYNLLLDDTMMDGYNIDPLQRTEDNVLVTNVNNPITVDLAQTFTILTKNKVEDGRMVMLKIKAKNNGPIFIVNPKTAPPGATDSQYYKQTVLKLSGNLVLEGKPGNTNALIQVNNGAKLILDDSVQIRGNDSNSNNNGAGVYCNGGEAVMGGNCTIEGNTGSGVSIVNNGTFTMTGGFIRGNARTGNNNWGGGVYLNGGTFNLNGGTITGNTTRYDIKDGHTRGGGVFINLGTFNMNSGFITSNSAINTHYKAEVEATLLNGFQAKPEEVGYAEGGGVYIANNANAKFLVRDASVKANIINNLNNTGHAKGGVNGPNVWKDGNGVYQVEGAVANPF